MKKIGIIGLGLIGGSLARAIRKNFPDVTIVASDKLENALEAAFKDNVIHEYSADVGEIFSGSDIVFVCAHVCDILGYIKEVSEYVSENCVITDVGSVKSAICKEIENINYIGGHPMAGTEKTGYENSNENLFVNAYYILTPSSSAKNEAVTLLENTIKGIGAISLIMDAQYHDFVAAAISHAPHVIAAALVNMVAALDNGSDTMHLLAGGGFRDITRISSSGPEMWKNISFMNKKELFKGIKEFRNQLDLFEERLERDDASGVYNFFRSAKEYRDSI